MSNPEDEPNHERLQAYLLALSDALRSLHDPVAIQETAQRLLAEWLDADRVAYAEDVGDGVHVQVTRDWTRGLPSLAGRFRYADYGEELTEALRSGHSLVRSDIASDPGMSLEEKQAHQVLGLGATLNVPLARNGAPIAILAVHFTAAHSFTAEEVAMAEATAERTWAAVERAQAEAALRQNEEKYRELFNSMDQGYCIIQVLYEGRQAVDWRFLEVNPAFERHNGLHDAAGKTMRELEPGIERKWIDTYAHVAETGESLRFEEGSDALGHRIFDLYAFRIGRPHERKVAVLFQDVTQSRQAEAALRASEERFRQFAGASSDVLWIRQVDTLALEFISQASQSVFGISPEAALADAEALLRTIVPEDRADVSLNLEAVRAGKAVVHEYRILRPTDHAIRWIRSTGFPIFDAEGWVDRVAGISTDITDVRQATDRQGVLLSELQHRVRNVMAVIRGIAARSADTAGTVENYASLLSGRLTTLARVQSVLTRNPDSGASLRTLIEEEVVAQAPQQDRFELLGDDIGLPPKATEVLALAIHELVTNAVKYGAFSGDTGFVSVEWQTAPRDGAEWLLLDWIERSGEAVTPPGRRGFGSELIESRIPYELSGIGRLEFLPSGLHCRLEFPLVNRPSIFQTNAPRPPAEDHAGKESKGGGLAHKRILVVDDDYYAAAEVVSAVTRIGAHPLDPCENAEEAHRALRHNPDAVVLDLNLGGDGPDFGLARTLRASGIPFVFLTGYDQAMLPPDLAATPCLQKPADPQAVIAALLDLLSPATPSPSKNHRRPR
ncbi:PAS domain-containing protein [Devosia sp. PTR5]|uniref:Blue-light-activated histidine kinase n=1 Tax=Devosia oryzisoli TaxID=2774138 RepID=A0A927FSH7_9HYPH|nr:PAS domain-containing protein [Devosia oryzisoli]